MTSREHWRRVHLAGDRNPPFFRSEPDKPHWIPEWEVKKLLAKRKVA